MRLLVVEDEPKMAALIKRGLERRGDVVDMIHSGEDALWMARAHEYDELLRVEPAEIGRAREWARAGPRGGSTVMN